MTHNDDDIFRQLLQNGVDIGFIQAHSRATGIATPRTEAMLNDLAKRNDTALRAAGQQIDPAVFRRRVQLRRRMDAAKQQAARASADKRRAVK